MSDGTTPLQQTGCSVVYLLTPGFMVAGGLVGWTIGRPYGLIPGVLGAVAGVVLWIPALGLTLLAVLGVVAAWERVTRSR
jgi:hypothetical protein